MGYLQVGAVCDGVSRGEKGRVDRVQLAANVSNVETLKPWLHVAVHVVLGVLLFAQTANLHV